MPSQSDAFALGQSDLNGFLFADIGLEDSGMPLSVISALARLGLDPWQEASRLAKLPRAVAADRLARRIAAMPASPWPLPAATLIATRLVELLPGHTDGPAVSVMQVRGWPGLLVAAAAAVLAASVVHFTAGPESTPQVAPQVAPNIATMPAPIAAPATPVQPPLGD